MNGDCYEGKEDHVWMDVKPFEKYQVGDCLRFGGEIYRYLKTGNGKQISFGIREPYDITTTSPVYREMYRRIVEMIPGIIQSETVEECTDIGGIEFQITYSDKNKVKKLFWVQGDYFADLFKLIKKIVPECEYIPAVLLTSECG